MPDRPITLHFGLFDIIRPEPTTQTESNSREVGKESPPLPTVPLAPPAQHRRQPKPDEPLAFCADCREWTPMEWLPVAERGRKAETWFQCGYCGNRRLTLRYLSLG